MAVQVFKAEATLALKDAKFTRQLAQAEGKVKGFGKGLKGKLGPLGKSSGPVGALATQFGMLGPAIATPAGAGVAAVAGLGAVMGSAVGSAKDFENDIARAFALVPDASSEMKDKLREDVQAIQTEFGITQDQAIQGLYDSLSQGVPPENVLQFLQDGSRLAVGQAIPLTQALSAQTTVMQAWGLNTGQAAAKMDLLATGVRLGGTDMAGFEAAMAKAGPTAAQMGVDVETLTALIADNTLITKDGDIAGTQMAEMFTELGRQGTKAFKAFEEANGTTFPEFIANGGDITVGLNNMSDMADRTDRQMVDLFSGMNAGRAAMIATRDDGENLISTQEGMIDSTGAVEQAYGTMQGTVQHNMDRIKQHMSTTMVDIGNAITPAVAAITGFIANAIPHAISFISTGIGGIVKIVKGFWKKIFGDATSVWSAIGNYLHSVGTILKDILLNAGRLMVWAMRKGLGLLIKWVGMGVDKIIELFVKGLKLIPGLMISLARKVVSGAKSMFGWIPIVGDGIKALDANLTSFAEGFENFGKDVKLVQNLGDWINPDEGPSLDFSDSLSALGITSNPFASDDQPTTNEALGGDYGPGSPAWRIGQTVGDGVADALEDNDIEMPVFAANDQGLSEYQRAMANIPTTTTPVTDPTVRAVSGGGGGGGGNFKKVGEEIVAAIMENIATNMEGFDRNVNAIHGIRDIRLIETVEMYGGKTVKAIHELRKEVAAMRNDAAGGGPQITNNFMIDRSQEIAREVAWEQTKQSLVVSP